MTSTKIAWVLNWESQTDYLFPEEAEVMLRLHAISVYPRETWDTFIAGVWNEARATLAARPHLALPPDDRARLSCPAFSDALGLAGGALSRCGVPAPRPPGRPAR